MSLSVDFYCFIFLSDLGSVLFVSWSFVSLLVNVPLGEKRTDVHLSFYRLWSQSNWIVWQCGHVSQLEEEIRPSRGSVCRERGEGGWEAGYGPLGPPYLGQGIHQLCIIVCGLDGLANVCVGSLFICTSRLAGSGDSLNQSVHLMTYLFKKQ